MNMKVTISLYQFPMGKVKSLSNMGVFDTSGVSIPYGKGKVKRGLKDDDWRVRYQFPMGKVKMDVLGAVKTGEEYQFPMGKVKNNILCCAYSVHHKYRFVN